MARLSNIMYPGRFRTRGDLVIVDINIGPVREWGVGIVDSYDEDAHELHLSKYWTFDRSNDIDAEEIGVEADNVVIHDGDHIHRTNLIRLAVEHHVFIPIKYLYNPGEVIWTGQIKLTSSSDSRGRRVTDTIELYGEIKEIKDHFSVPMLNRNLSGRDYLNYLTGIAFSWIKPGLDRNKNIIAGFDDTNLKEKILPITDCTRKMDSYILEQLREFELLREYVVRGNVL